jgi:hypothetical protein
MKGRMRATATDLAAVDRPITIAITGAGHLRSIPYIANTLRKTKSDSEYAIRANIVVGNNPNAKAT